MYTARMYSLMMMACTGMSTLGTYVPESSQSPLMTLAHIAPLPGQAETMIPVTQTIRDLACAMPLVASLAEQLHITGDVHELQQLCADVHRGVSFIPQYLLHDALEQALSCLREVQIRLARELAVHWLLALEQYVVQLVQQQWSGSDTVMPDPEDDLQRDGGLRQ